MTVAVTQIVETQRDLTNANARLVSVEMATTAQVSQHFCSVVSWLQADLHCTDDLWMRLSLSFFVWLMYKNLVLSPGLTVKSLSRSTSLKRTPIGESLLTSLFTFFLITIRLNSLKPWPYIRTKCKSWKSWLSWTICVIFSSLQAIEDECPWFLSAISLVTVPFPILALFLNKLSLMVVQMWKLFK